MANAELRNARKDSSDEAFVVLRECTLCGLALTNRFIIAFAEVWVLQGTGYCQYGGKDEYRIEYA